MDQPFSRVKVYGLLLLGLLAFGFAPILVKYAADYSSLQLAAVRTLIAALLLLPIYIRSVKTGDEKPALVEHKWMALSGVLLGLHFISWISSIYFTSVASASVLVVMHPVILLTAERFLFKVKFSGTIWAGIFIAITGSVVLGYSDYNADAQFSNPALGNGLALLAAAIFAAYFLIGRKVRQHHSWIGYVFPVYAWAAVTCIVFLFLVEGFVIPTDSKLLLIGAALAIGPQIMGHGSLNYAVKYVPPTLLSTLILSEPLLASFLAFILFTEIPATLSIIAMFIILIGVGFTWKQKPKDEFPVSD